MFRKPLVVADEHTNEYYRNKVVLIRRRFYWLRVVQTVSKNESKTNDNSGYL